MKTATKFRTNLQLREKTFWGRNTCCLSQASVVNYCGHQTIPNLTPEGKESQVPFSNPPQFQVGQLKR